MTDPVPPHYTAFRLVLVVAIVLALAVGLAAPDVLAALLHFLKVH